jgi:hypothetical protein
LKEHIENSVNEAIKLVETEAVKKEVKEKEKVATLVNIIFKLCNLCGYYVEGRIALRNKTTGQVWK